MRFKVTYEVDIDPAAWELNYGTTGPDAITEMETDLHDWTAELFDSPKWHGTTPGPARVNVTQVRTHKETSA